MSESLAAYASRPEQSRGRRHAEPPPDTRNEYQRDRDRIVHCAAFRRLEYKTQVFVNHEGDMFRTRLTHSIEVAQIGRSIARVLKLNEDLVEAIALAHDLGHTPFGHAGQDVLNECMHDYGGFEHNLQSLRVVDELEEKYAEFEGLNLTFETREGILKHCSRKNAEALGDVGRRFLDNQQPSLEAQLANVADEIAYNNHDVDDGLRAGLLNMDQLTEVRLFRDQHDLVTRLYPNLAPRRTVHEIVRRMINRQVSDLVDSARRTISSARIADVAAVRARPEPLVVFSDEMRDMNLELKRFLRINLYSHYRVQRMTTKAKLVIKELFSAFLDDVRLLPPDPQIRAQQFEATHGMPGRARAIADYVAGMTDRYAITEHERLFSPMKST